MSARTPSMTLTTSPTTRPSSSTTRTTSFDLRSARRHRGRWGPLRCGRNCSAGSVVRPENVYRVAKAWQWQTTATKLRALR